MKVLECVRKDGKPLCEVEEAPLSAGGDPETCDTFYRVVSTCDGNRQAHRHTDTQTKVRHLVRHPKITSEGHETVFSHKTVLTTFTFHLLTVCHPVPLEVKCCIECPTRLTRAGVLERGGQLPRAGDRSVTLTLGTAIALVLGL